MSTSGNTSAPVFVHPEIDDLWLSRDDIPVRIEDLDSTFVTFRVKVHPYSKTFPRTRMRRTRFIEEYTFEAHGNS